jgi:hypothetical protein
MPGSATFTITASTTRISWQPVIGIRRNTAGPGHRGEASAFKIASSAPYAGLDPAVNRSSRAVDST